MEIKILLIVFIPLLINLFQLSIIKSGSDHFVQLDLIQRIRKNGNRFILKQDNLLYNQEVAYPQFLHWFLSYFPDGFNLKYAKYINLFFSVLSPLTFIFFCYSIRYWNIKITDEIIFTATLLFVLIPYNYYFENAKNVGISSRGLGLWLGEVYLYLIVSYILSGNAFFLVAAALIFFLILISSQFSMQFVIFSLPLLAVLYKRPELLLVLLGGIGIFYFLMPNVFVNFVKGQIGHKRLYSKYLASKFILRYRPSIWRDWVFDFWKVIGEDLKKGTHKSVNYIMSNSLAIFLWSFFILPVTLYFFIFEDKVAVPIKGSSFGVLIIPVLASCIIFFLTTFRKTRFLGEPERYLEFVKGLAIVYLLLVVQPGNQLIKIIMVALSLLSLINLGIAYLFSRISNAKEFMNSSQKIEEALVKEVNKNRGSEARIMSNNIEMIRLLLPYDFKVFYGNFINSRVGKHHFNSVFSAYPFIKGTMIMPIIEEYKINYVIFDKSDLISFENFYTNFQNKEEILSTGSITLYKVH